MKSRSAHPAGRADAADAAARRKSNLIGRRDKRALERRQQRDPVKQTSARITRKERLAAFLLYLPGDRRRGVVTAPHAPAAAHTKNNKSAPTEPYCNQSRKGAGTRYIPRYERNARVMRNPFEVACWAPATRLIRASSCVSHQSQTQLVSRRRDLRVWLWCAVIRPRRRDGEPCSKVANQ